MDAPMRRCERIVLMQCRKGHDRPKKSWNKVIRHNLRTLGLTEEIAKDRKL